MVNKKVRALIVFETPTTIIIVVDVCCLQNKQLPLKDQAVLYCTLTIIYISMVERGVRYPTNPG
jgi:hypothetical protein